MIRWLAFHAAALLFALAGAFRFGGIGLDADLFSLIPQGASERTALEADKILAQRTGRKVFVLAESDSPEEARAAVLALEDALRSDSDGAFAEISARVGPSFTAEVLDFFKKNKFFLIQPNSPEFFERQALAMAYGGFCATGGAFMDEDPFFLTDAVLSSYMEKLSSIQKGVSLQGDVLAAKLDGKCYALFSVTLTEEGSAMGGKKNGAMQIFSQCEKIEAASGARFYYSGVPFHSYESASGAKREVAVISAVSMLAVALLLLWAFRSAAPILCTVFAIGCSVLAALCGVLGVWGSIHILTFVFGTTLIGTCVDYSIHYFATGIAGRGLNLSLLSTVLCYAALLLAPFTLLRQVAVFSIFGLCSSYCSVKFLFATKIKVEKKCAIPELKIPPKAKKIVLAAAAGIALLAVGANSDKLKIQNDISRLYTMSERMKEGEILCAKVLKSGITGGYFILRGSSAEELAQNEEALCRELGDCQALSKYLPSAKRQAASLESAAALVPRARRQFENLGFPPEESQRLGAEYENSFNEFARNPEFIALEKNVPPAIASLCENLWIGQVGGEYFSAVIPQNAGGTEELRAIAQKFEFAQFLDKRTDTSAALDSLSRLIALLFAAAFALIFIALLFFYKIRDALRICAVPAFVTLAVCAANCAFGIRFEFFSIIALVLSLGLSLDYIIHVTESGESSGAVLLSFLTTLLSFGALAFSSFVPVHAFGMTVALGISAAFLCTRLLSPHEK